MSTRPCPHCGNVVDEKARFCGQCGTTIVAGSNLGKTLLDENPFGASITPGAPAEPLHKPAAKTLMQTLADPNADVHAKELLAAALETEQDRTQDARPIAAGKTMLLAETPAPAPAAAPPVAAPPRTATPPHVTAPLASSTTAPLDSPLSKSVMAPGSMAPSSMAQTDPNPQVAAHLAASPAASPSSPGPLGASAMKTMFGMPATALPSSSRFAAAAPAEPAEPAAPPQAPPQQAPVPPASESAPHSQQLPPAMRTMLGVAIPGIAPSASTAPEPPQQALNVNKPAGTLLGVAIPGIAPSHVPPNPSSGKQAAAPLYAQHNSGTNLGMPAAAVPPSAAPIPPPNRGLRTLALPQAPLPIVPAPAPLIDEPLPEAPHLPEKRGVPILAVIGIVFLLVAAFGGAAAFFVLRGGTALTAQPQLDEHGKESLRIKCESCPDGTKVALGASSAQVAASAALLPLPAPLKIGDNDLDIQIDRPSPGRDETVRIHVPVAYRVRADMATLAAKPPTITVRVEATAGSDVTVEGKPVKLDGTGRGSYAIDLSPDVEGTSDDSKTVEKKIAFTIAAKGAKAEAGSLVARAAIVPLHLDSPGAVLYTDRATAAVSGQTKAGGSVSIDGAVSPIDAQGRFGARVELAEASEKTLEIVASSPPLAPRIARSKVTRVASLEATAKELESNGPLAYDAFSPDAAGKVGQAVAIDGDVVESRAQQGYTVMLVDAKKCAAATRTERGACLVRVVHGEEMKAARGDTVRAYGVLEGVVTASGKQVPDIEASLLIVKGPGKK